MAEKNTNTTTQSPFNPAQYVNPAQFAPTMDAWKKMVGESTERMEMFATEATKAQERMIAFANSQIDELSAMAKTQVKYFNDLATDWRKVSLEAANKTTEMLNK